MSLCYVVLCEYLPQKCPLWGTIKGHCIVLYCIVLYCIVLYCIVLYCIVLYCIVLYCIVLYCIVFVFVQGNVWSKSVPLVIFGVLSLVGSGVTLVLPETLGLPLMDTIEQAENMGRDSQTDQHPETGQCLLQPLPARSQE